MKKDHNDTRQKESDEKEQVQFEAEPENDVAEENPVTDNALEEEIARLKDDYLRVLAEAENVKKRCAAEIEKNNKYAIASFAKDLLSVADNLARAVAAGETSAANDCSGVIKGVELTMDELTHVFSKFGIEPIESVGNAFNPNFQRAVQEIEDAEAPAGTVITELQKGYTLNGRILREAMVVVSKGK